MSHNEQQIGDSTGRQELAEEIGLTQATPANPVYLRDTGKHGEVVAVYNCDPYLEATATTAGAADRTTWTVEVPLLVEDIQEGNLEVVNPRFIGDAETVVDRDTLADAETITRREREHLASHGAEGEYTDTVERVIAALSEVLDR